MSSQTAHLPSTSAPSAAGTEGFSRPNPVCTEIGVSVQGSGHSSAGGSASQPFLEQTSTVIVFAQGAVVRLSETVAPGQILILRNLQTNEEAACRVVSVKSNPNVKGYVELEFLQHAPKFWGMEFPAPAAIKAPSAAVAHAEPRAAAEIPKAVAAQPISPAPTPRHTAPPSEEGNGATGSGLTFLPDLLESLALPGEAKQHAPESATRPEAPHATPIHAERVASPDRAERVASPDRAERVASPDRAERVASNDHAQHDASKQSAPVKPLVAPWVAAPRTDITKAAPGAGDGRYISDLLDTLTPVGETILREKPNSAASQPQTHTAPPAPASSRPAFVAPAVARPAAVTFAEPSSAEIALPALAAEAAHVASRAVAPLVLPSLGPEVAPLLSGGEMISREEALSRGETLSRGDLLNGDLAQAASKQAWPTPMRILAAAAALALAMAAGAGIYRWEKRPGPDANLAASSQPALTAATPGAATASPSDAQPASNPAPYLTASSSSEAPAKDSRAAAQPSANAAPSATKSPAVVRGVTVVTAPRGPIVAAMKISAPTSAARSTNQTAPSIAANEPGSVENASAGGILGYAQPSGPVAPVPVRTSSGAQQPRLLSSISPSYPYSARAEHVQGDVSVDMVIDELGKVASMNVISGPALLRQAALDALRRRKYAPAMLDGKPTTAHIVVVIHFQL